MSCDRTYNVPFTRDELAIILVACTEKFNTSMQDLNLQKRILERIREYIHLSEQDGDDDEAD